MPHWELYILKISPQQYFLHYVCVCVAMLDISRQLYTEVIDDISGEYSVSLYVFDHDNMLALS